MKTLAPRLRIDRKPRLEIELPDGAHQAECLDPARGTVVRTEDFRHAGGIKKLVSPKLSQDVALSVKTASR